MDSPIGTLADPRRQELMYNSFNTQVCALDRLRRQHQHLQQAGRGLLGAQGQEQGPAPYRYLQDCSVNVASAPAWLVGALVDAFLHSARESWGMLRRGAQPMRAQRAPGEEGHACAPREAVGYWVPQEMRHRHWMIFLPQGHLVGLLQQDGKAATAPFWLALRGISTHWASGSA